ncbi:MAG: response regulator [bacterium]
MAQKILIVDDDQVILKVEEYNLKQAGYEVISAVNGAEAIRKVQEEKPELIILDVSMPIMDGYEVCQRIREEQLTSHIPILMLSVHKEVEDKVKGLKTGANDYIIKPFNPQELLARVEVNLRRSKYDIEANPLTGLPGNISIMDKIEERMKNNKHFSTLYLDLDNFKAFNDRYGYELGDEVIKLTGHTIVQAVEDIGNQDDFIGHIGGDDFIVLTTPDRVDSICQQIIAKFDASVPGFYNEEDQKRGYIVCEDRRGQIQKFPLMSISIACVSNEKKKFSHPGELTTAAAEVKKYAKSIVGSTYVKDKRIQALDKKNAISKSLSEHSKVFNLTVTNQLNSLPLIADFIIKTAKELNLDKNTIFDIQTAVEEACENIVEHAYPKGEAGPINLHCELKGDEFIVKIRDHGRAFDLNSVPTPDLDASIEQRTTGGLGIYFMKSLMDEVNFSFDPEKGNELVMKKYINQVSKITQGMRHQRRCGEISMQNLLSYLSKTEKKVITSFVKEIQEKLKKDIVSIWLFGSKVRGDFEKDSDIDIFVLIKRRNGVREKISEIAGEYFFKTNIPLAPVIYTLYEYRKNKELGSFFFENIEREGVILYESDRSG